MKRTLYALISTLTLSVGLTFALAQEKPEYQWGIVEGKFGTVTIQHLANYADCFSNSSRQVEDVVNPNLCRCASKARTKYVLIEDMLDALTPRSKRNPDPIRKNCYEVVAIGGLYRSVQKGTQFPAENCITESVPPVPVEFCKANGIYSSEAQADQMRGEKVGFGAPAFGVAKRP